MYLLTWNPDQNQVEASFGGHITPIEVKVFNEEIRDLLERKRDRSFEVTVDYSTAAPLDTKTMELLSEMREICLFSGASRVTFITRDENEAAVLTNSRLQDVLQGRERYLAYSA